MDSAAGLTSSCVGPLLDLLNVAVEPSLVANVRLRSDLGALFAGLLCTGAIAVRADRLSDMTF